MKNNAGWSGGSEENNRGLKAVEHRGRAFSHSRIPPGLPIEYTKLKSHTAEEIAKIDLLNISEVRRSL